MSSGVKTMKPCPRLIKVERSRQKSDGAVKVSALKVADRETILAALPRTAVPKYERWLRGQIRRIRRDKTDEYLLENATFVTDECGPWCVKRWLTREDCAHGKRLSPRCATDCFSRLGRGRLCEHVIKLCSFCNRPNVPHRMECVCYDGVKLL